MTVGHLTAEFDEASSYSAQRRAIVIKEVLSTNHRRNAGAFIDRAV
jgi:hypothetical protein